MPSFTTAGVAMTAFGVVVVVLVVARLALLVTHRRRDWAGRSGDSGAQPIAEHDGSGASQAPPPSVGEQDRFRGGRNFPDDPGRAGGDVPRSPR